MDWAGRLVLVGAGCLGLMAGWLIWRSGWWLAGAGWAARLAGQRGWAGWPAGWPEGAGLGNCAGQLADGCWLGEWLAAAWAGLAADWQVLAVASGCWQVLDSAASGWRLAGRCWLSKWLRWTAGCAGLKAGRRLADGCWRVLVVADAGGSLKSWLAAALGRRQAGEWRLVVVAEGQETGARADRIGKAPGDQRVRTSRPLWPYGQKVAQYPASFRPQGHLRPTVGVGDHRFWPSTPISRLHTAGWHTAKLNLPFAAIYEIEGKVKDKAKGQAISRAAVRTEDSLRQRARRQWQDKARQGCQAEG
ncbi:uncharacterized protein PSFLO_06417 [Pseudozyma flocculosa]|uniref:Uncharacterized protein n=1 Tax=Pseudozyma flocculosa TaxID=84751 RepID=A0A5C3FB66_9BASI|nr:uncharacterized protein PSFLO_06417 [Pseudozyma flocculosa]